MYVRTAICPVSHSVIQYEAQEKISALLIDIIKQKNGPNTANKH